LVSKETPLQATARNQATKHGCQIEWNAWRKEGTIK
jgi:hypothetical protein